MLCVCPVCALQRFGSGAVMTHSVGAALLKGEWSKVVDLLLLPREGEVGCPSPLLFLNGKKAIGISFLPLTPSRRNEKRGVRLIEKNNRGRQR